MTGFLVKMGTIDRRWIFLVIALAVIIPLLLNMGAPMPATPIVQKIYDKIESLPPGSHVIMSLDYGPATVPENQPMADALARHCMEKDLKLILMALWPTGVRQIDVTIENLYTGDDATHPDKVYGEDWLNIGYKAGNQGVINVILNDFKGLFTTDSRDGQPIDSFPIMKGVANLRDLELILCIGSGKPGMKEWIQFAGDQGHIPVAGGVTAVEAPLLYPYYPRQLVGLMGGLQGAAEYESALLDGYPSLAGGSEYLLRAATRKMGPQTVAHLMILLFVIIGNIALFASRRERS